MKFTGKDKLNIIADIWGQSDNPLVVLLHGGGQTRHAWGNSGKILSSAGFHVVAMDLRGHGDSDWHPDGDSCFQFMGISVCLYDSCDR